MANMSYCRFRNTLSDYRDCYEALIEGDIDSDNYEEIKAAEELIKMSFNLIDELGLIEDDSLNHEELRIMIERIKDGCQ